ncbi:hypothetical protein AB0G15_27180 [Streptosporangium sp. NPDC023825]|uniref:hypothetical protein n=1 Tax=Streptosporangium sp. NPDC023825 TaxID=3154909 RepID=UPI00343F8F29
MPESRDTTGLADEIRSTGGRSPSVVTDVRDETGGAAAVAAVAFLAPPDAAHSTGTGPVVDGGGTAMKASA